MATEAETGIATQILKQASKDTMTVYRTLRESMRDEDVGASNRDVVAATLTAAVFARMDQIAGSLD